MTVIRGMNNVTIILTKPISYLKQEKQSMDSCVISYNTLLYESASLPNVHLGGVLGLWGVPACSGGYSVDERPP